MSVASKVMISLQDTAALPYIEEAASSLREQMLALLRELPEDMKASGKAVNAEIKDVFEEGNFAFAMYEEKDRERPNRKFLGISSLSSFLPFTYGTYLANNTNAGLIEFIEKNYSAEQCATDLLSFMLSLDKEKSSPR